jgi:hypothetical protein
MTNYYDNYENDSFEKSQNAMDFNGRALRAIQESLTFALNLPSDPEFQKACRTIENMHSAEGIVNQIRDKYKNADDLAKIASAIEAMREELIEESAARFERHTHQ